MEILRPREGGEPRLTEVTLSRGSAVHPLLAADGWSRVAVVSFVGLVFALGLVVAIKKKKSEIGQ